jgi:hypothetical protein
MTRADQLAAVRAAVVELDRAVRALGTVDFPMGPETFAVASENLETVCAMFRDIPHADLLLGVELTSNSIPGLCIPGRCIPG